MFSKMAKWLLLINILACSIYLGHVYTEVRLSSEALLQHMLVLEKENIVGVGRQQPKVAVGYDACRILFVNATALLDFRVLKGKPEHFNEITNKEELLQSFTYFFQHGAAAERFTSNSELFKDLIEQALKLADTKWAVGGNAAVIAKRFNTEGWSVLLAAKLSKKLKEFIPSEIKIVGNEPNEEVQDDIHMILAYKADEEFGEYKAPRANRYIIHNDMINPLLSSLEKFGESLPQFKPNLLFISGLQMMDNYPFKGNGVNLKEKRLDLVREQILNQPDSTLVHFEMASFVDIELIQHLTNKVLPYVNSIGMNEQEVANLHSILEHGEVSVVADSNPRVAMVFDFMRFIFAKTRQLNQEHGSERELTRIHVHTLAYQVILIVKDSNWKRTRAAAAKASITAHRHVCDNPKIELDHSKLLLDRSFAVTQNKNDSRRMYFDSTEPIACWDEQVNKQDVEICVVPVLVCKEARVTAGAGDNISAAGLVLQVVT